MQGFGQDSGARIAVNAGAGILAKPLQALSLVGGDVQIDRGRIGSQGGDIRIIAFGGLAGEVSVAGELPIARGNMDILNGGYVWALSDDAYHTGNILIATGTLTVECEFRANGASPKFYPVRLFPNNLTEHDDGLAHAVDNTLPCGL